MFYLNLDCLGEKYFFYFFMQQETNFQEITMKFWPKITQIFGIQNYLKRLSIFQAIVKLIYFITRFSILGFGDSTYCNNFCAFPKLINKFLKFLNLKEIHSIGLADQTKNEEEVSYSWLSETLLVIF